MLRALIWKEWRECRWKMLVLFAMYQLLVLGAWAWEKHDPFEQAQVIIMALSLIMPGIVAMGTIADERVRRTADTLEAMPVSMSWVFFIKTLGGLATLLLPLAVVEGFCFLVLPGPRDGIDTNLGTFTGFMSLMGLVTSLYLWILALAARRRTELGVGATYVMLYTALAMGAVVLELIHAFGPRYSVNSRAIYDFASAINPLGFLNVLTHSPDEDGIQYHLKTTFILQLVLWLPLWEVAFWRYSRTSPLRIARPTERPRALPKSPLTPQRHPVLWKTWREIRTPVLGCAGLLLAFITLDSLLIQNALTRGWYFVPGTELLVPIPAFIGMIMAILLGTDVGLREAEVPLENFWHSRPIPQSTYFRRRFSINLLCALALVILPTATSLAITSWQLATTTPPPPEVLNPGQFMGRSAKPVFVEVQYRVSRRPELPQRPPEWPPSRDAYAVQTMLSHLSQAQDTATTFLLLYTPQAILFFSLSAFAASLARRRIIPLVFSFGTAIAFQMLFADTDTSRWISRQWDLAAYFWLLWALYTFLLLTLAATLAWLATKSTTARWRARLEARTETLTLTTLPTTT